MPQNFYEVLWIFIIYAFIGWCAEVSYAAVNRGIFVNRGFLNGPYCPIYGCGVVIVVTVLTPLKDNLFLLFVGSVVLTSVLEYITGFLLERVFHNKWWDYSNLPFNLHGYICLKFSIYWGLACTFIMDIIHPIIYKFITLIPQILGIVLISIGMTVFAVDITITVMTIMKLNKRMKAMDEIAKKIHKLSDQETHEDILQKIENTKEDIQEKTSEFSNKQKLAYEEKVQELEKLKQKYAGLMERREPGVKRLMKAFPNMRSLDFKDTLEKYKKQFDKIITKKSEADHDQNN